MKKLLALCLLLCTGITVRAYDIKADGIYYNKVAAAQVAVTAGERAYIGAVTIPSTIEADGQTWTVTQIGDAAFYGCDELYTLTLPATVTTIGNEAFVRCSWLTNIIVDEDNPAFSSVGGALMDKQQRQLLVFPAGRYSEYSVPDGIETIGPWAFTHCTRLRTVTLPASVRTISDAAFYGCTAITAITLPAKLQTIGVWAFAECSALSEIRLPATVGSVGDGAFSFCSSLANIYVESGSNNYSSADGVLLNKQKTIVVACPGARTGTYHIPATVDSIATQAFYGCTQLETVVLSAKLSSVATNPFVFCDNLKEIQVDKNNSRYVSQDGVLFSKDRQQLVFYPNAKSGIYSVPNSVTALDHGPFLGSVALTGIDIPASVRTIGDWTFLGCQGLQAVNIPYAITKIGTQAFSDCTALKTIICNGAPVATSAFEDATLEGATLYVPKGRKADYLSTEGWGGFSHIEEFGLYATDQSLSRAQELRVPVCITRTLPIVSAQMQLELPEGVSIVTQGQGSNVKYMVEMSRANANSHSVSCMPLAERTFLLSVNSTSGTALADSDTLLFVTVAAQPDCEAGVHDMTLKNISFTYMTEANRGEALQNDAIAGLNVRLFVGDVNQNGRLNVADVVETTRYVNGIASENFHFDEADVNRNNVVNRHDAELTVELIHQQAAGSPLVVSDYWQAAAAKATDKLSAAAVSAEQGAVFMLNISLAAVHTNLTAYQFVLEMPEGFSLSADADGIISCTLPSTYAGSARSVSAQLAASAATGNGTTLYSIVGSSSELTTLMNSGELVAIPVTTRRHTPVGTYTIPVSQVMLADTEGQEYYLANTNATVLLTQSSGISTITNDGNKPAAVYDLGGRKVTESYSNRLNKGVYIIEGRKVAIK